MATIKELEYAAYATQTGLSGVPLSVQKLSFYNLQLGTTYSNVQEAEIAFLKNKTGLNVNHIDHLWRSYMIDQGVTHSNSFHEMQKEFFLNYGFQNLQSYIKSLSGLVAYWPLDETSGNAINQAPDTLGSYDGTVVGATQGVAGQVGNAYQFDGVNDFIGFGNINQNFQQNHTIGVLIKPLTLDGNSSTRYSLVSNDKEFANKEFNVQITGDGKIAINFYNSSGITVSEKITSSAPLSINNYYFIFIRVNKDSDVLENLIVNDSSVTWTDNDISWAVKYGASPEVYFASSRGTGSYTNCIAQHLFFISSASSGVLTTNQCSTIVNLSGL